MEIDKLTLKVEIEEAVIERAKNIVKEGAEEIRKETAREILNDIHTFIHSETMREGYELKKIDGRLNELAERHGVDISK